MVLKIVKWSDNIGQLSTAREWTGNATVILKNCKCHTHVMRKLGISKFCVQ